MSDPWAVGGSTALREHAPTADAAFGGLAALWPESLSAAQLSAIRRFSADAVGLAPLPLVADGPQRAGDDRARYVEAFAAQFALDVTEVGDELRGGWVRDFGRDAFDAALGVYVAEYVPRVRRVLDQLFGACGWVDPDLTRTAHARDVLDSFNAEVLLLARIDPVTAELARLRSARLHRCRVCMARRSLAAVRAGADSATFEAVDDYRGSRLDAGQQAALALTDAIISSPTDIAFADGAAVRTHLSPAVAVELVLGVMRSASNKIAVALGADAADHEGVQFFEVDAGGRLSFS